MDPGFERLKDYNLSEEYMISNKQNLKFKLHGHPMDLFLKISVLPLKRWFSSFGHTQFPLDPPLPTAPPPHHHYWLNSAISPHPNWPVMS